MSTSSVGFGNVVVGKTSSQSLTVTNSGGADLTLSQASISGTGFSVTGLSLPATLAAGQSADFSVNFAPTATGSVTGSLVLVSDAVNSSATLNLSGTGVESQLTVAPTAVPFGNVVVGSTSSKAVTLSNSGNVGLTLSQANLSGAGFSVTGLSLPLTLGAGKSVSAKVNFSPTATGSVTGSLVLVSTAADPSVAISLSGTGVEPQISVVPSTISFGNVTVGNTNTQTVTVSDTGNATLTLSQANLSGSAFSISGLTLPASIAPGQHTSFNVAFSPGSAASFTGSLSIVSNAPNSPTAVTLSGTGVAATQQLTVSPTSLTFGNVTVNQTSTKSVTVSNSGNSSVTISQVNVSGTGFSASGLTPPVTLDASQSATISVAFAPTSSGSVTGSLSIVSNAANSPSTVSLSGSGVTSSSTLSISPTSLSFGNVTVSQTSTKSVTVSNSGNSSVSISQVNVSGTGFSASGLTPPVTLDAGKSATINVAFAPTSSGSVTGSLSVVSNASNSPSTVSLSGSGVTSTSHSVALSWTASTSTVSGYDVYRSSQSGGTYTKLNSSLITGTSYTDNTVQAGQTYYYVTTAVNSSSVESTDSNEVKAVIPSP